MTRHAHQPECGYLLDDAATEPELAGLEALDGPPARAPRPDRGAGPSSNADGALPRSDRLRDRIRKYWRPLSPDDSWPGDVGAGR